MHIKLDDISRRSGYERNLLLRRSGPIREDVVEAFVPSLEGSRRIRATGRGSQSHRDARRRHRARPESITQWIDGDGVSAGPQGSTSATRRMVCRRIARPPTSCFMSTPQDPFKISATRREISRQEATILCRTLGERLRSRSDNRSRVGDRRAEGRTSDRCARFVENDATSPHSFSRRRPLLLTLG